MISKLDRTQTAEELLRLGMQSNNYLHLRINSIQINKSHDFFIGARGVSGTAVTAGY